MNINQTYRPGEVVYIIIRNPHAQDVAHVQQAAVIENPDSPLYEGKCSRTYPV